jgi:hypothetical protein
MLASQATGRECRYLRDEISTLIDRASAPPIRWPNFPPEGSIEFAPRRRSPLIKSFVFESKAVLTGRCTCRLGGAFHARRYNCPDISPGSIYARVIFLPRSILGFHFVGARLFQMSGPPARRRSDSATAAGTLLSNFPRRQIRKAAHLSFGGGSLSFPPTRTISSFKSSSAAFFYGPIPTKNA